MPKQISAVIKATSGETSPTSALLFALITFLSFLHPTLATQAPDVFFPLLQSKESFSIKKLFHPSKYLKNIYITLGPYFADKSDERVFRVGATLDYLIPSKDKYQRKLIEEFESEITGKSLDRDIEHVRLSKENFMKMMTMNYADRTEEEQIKDFIEDYKKITKISEFTSLKSFDETEARSGPRPDSRGQLFSEKEKVVRNQKFLDSMERLIQEVRRFEEAPSADAGEAKELRQTEMFQVFRKLLTEKNLGTKLLKNASGSGAGKMSRNDQLILKKISLTESIKDFYNTYCDKELRNCRKRLSSEEMQKETKAGHLDLKNEIWTVTNGSPRLALSLIKLVVTTPSNDKFEFGISDLNEYKYKGFYKGEPLDYKRIFIFFDITNEVTNLCKFKYEIYYKDSLVKGPYHFASNVKDPVAKPKIVSMGYHDNSVFGQTAIDRLSAFHYDLLVVPGNLGIEAYQENFRTFEDYFDQMEKNFTRAPVMMLPGQFEQVDQFAMFGSKFLTLNLRNYLDLDVFQCHVNSISVFFLNLTKVVQSTFRFAQVYEAFLEQLKQVTSLEKKNNRGSKWRILVTNEPLFCSGVAIDNQKCMKNLFLLKPFHDLARAYGIEIFLSGGTSYYERIELPNFRDFREIRMEHETRESQVNPASGDHPEEKDKSVKVASRDVAEESSESSQDAEYRAPSKIGQRILEEDLEDQHLSKIRLSDMEKKLHMEVLDEDFKEQEAISRDFKRKTYGREAVYCNTKEHSKITERKYAPDQPATTQNHGFLDIFNRENLQAYLPAINPLFQMQGPSYIINVGSAGFARGFTPSRLNYDKKITKNKKTSMKGFVLLTFLNRDSRVFYIDFKNLEIQDFILISSKKVHLIVYKYFFFIVIFVGLLAVCLYANGETCLRIGGCFKISKNSNDFEYLLYEQKKIAQQLREEEKVEQMIEAQRIAEEDLRSPPDSGDLVRSGHESGNEMSVHND